jgi:hypothetical protein
MRAAIIGLAVLVAVGCGVPKHSMGSIEQLTRALVEASWRDVAFHPVDTSSLSESGVTHAGMMIYGRYHWEIYQAADMATVPPVAAYFTESGLAVYTCGVLIAVVPNEKGAVSVVRKLTDLGFVPVDPPR